MATFARLLGVATAALCLGGMTPAGSAQAKPVKLKLSKSPHIDLRGAYMFNPPEGWEGTPAEGKYFGEGTAMLGKTNGVEHSAWYDWAAMEKGNFAFVARDSDYKGRVDDGVGDAKAYIELQLGRGVVGYAFRQAKIEITSEEPGALGGLPGKIMNFTQTVKQITIQDEKERKKAEERQLKKTVRGRVAVVVTEGRLYACGLTTTAWVYREVPGMDALADQMFRTFRVLSKGDMVGYNKKYGKGEVVCADWKTYTTKNYRIQYNTDDKFAQKLGQHLEAIRVIYSRLWPMSGQTKPFLVKCYNSEAGYYGGGGPGGSAGYFSPGQKELVTYKTDAETTLVNDAGEAMTFDLGEAGDTSFHIMYHEAFHQYCRIHTGENRFGVEIPSWFNEGMGDYFFGGQLKGNGIKIEENWWRVDTIKRHVRKNTHVPWKKILRYTQSDYYQDASKCYAEGWAICYYLLDVGPKRIPSLAGKFVQVPVVMMNELEKHGDGQKATERAWAGIDVDAVEKDWCEWVSQLEFPAHVQAALAKAEAKANQVLIDDAVEAAKYWTEKQPYVKEGSPPCTGVMLQVVKGKKYKGCCRGAYESEFKERTLEEVQQMLLAAIEATSKDSRLITGTIYFPLPLWADDDAELEAMQEQAKILKDWCDGKKVRLSQLPAGFRFRMKDDEGGD